jgi:hypothetical protein
MPKKFVVTKVSVREEASTTQYLKTSGSAAEMKELLKGVKDMKNWIVTSKGDTGVAEAHPVVDKHPGHVDGSNWKMNVEHGNGSVDRLFLKLRKYTVIPNKTNKDQLNVEISCSAFTEQDTH